MAQKAVLVTGGAGFIGSHVCKALAKAGCLPITYDSLVTGHREAVRWGPFEQGDILDPARLAEVLRKHRPMAAVHLASFISVGESVREPEKYRRNNFEGSRALLEALVQHGVKLFVFSSSAAVYGMPRALPLSEAHAMEPINPYGETKRDVELLLGDLARTQGLRSVSLRYFNAAGADPERETGELHEPETHLIPLAIRAATGQGPQLQVFGDDYETPDGTCLRDYIHVSDLADAHVLALRRLESGAGGGAAAASAVAASATAYNLGNQRGFSVREVIAVVERVSGLKVPVAMGPRRAGDPPVLVADSTRALAELGWRPMHASLEEIVRTAWEWHRKHFSISKQ